MRSQISADVSEMIKLVKEVKDIPCAIGFGISKPEQVAAMAEISDGVIVGSAIVKICEEYGEDCVPYVEEYVKYLCRM
jgi:tryptophan synthase alpha chain